MTRHRIVMHEDRLVGHGVWLSEVGPRIQGAQLEVVRDAEQGRTFVGLAVHHASGPLLTWEGEPGSVLDWYDVADALSWNLADPAPRVFWTVPEHAEHIAALMAGR